MPADAAPRSPTPTDRLLQLLVELAREGQPLGARELAQRCELPLSTAYRHLDTLKAWGLVAEAGRNGGVGLGPTCALIARWFDRPEHLLATARPVMQELALAAGESVGLMVAVGHEVVCLDMVESAQPLRCAYAPGRAQPMARGASAKALLAPMAPARQAAVLEATLADARARRALLEDLPRIRERGFAESEGEVDPAVWGVSVPIAAPGGRLDAALSLMAPAERARPQRERLVALTRAGAAEIARRLRAGGRPEAGAAAA
jgi:DNA-binding IclR family transcriptional regulator